MFLVVAESREMIGFNEPSDQNRDTEQMAHLDRSHLIIDHWYGIVGRRVSKYHVERLFSGKQVSLEFTR